MAALPSSPPSGAWARPRTTQKPSWGDGHEAEAGRRVRQGWAGVLSGSFRAGSGPSLHQRRVPPLTHRVSCPAGTVLPKVLLGPTVCSWHFSPLGRPGSGHTQEALVPSAMLSSSCSSAQLAHGPVQSLPLGPRASFLKEGDFHVFFFLTGKCVPRSTRMNVETWQAVRNLPASSKPRPAPSLPRLQERWHSPPDWTHAAALAQSVPAPSMLT